MGETFRNTRKGVALRRWQAGQGRVRQRAGLILPRDKIQWNLSAGPWQDLQDRSPHQAKPAALAGGQVRHQQRLDDMLRVRQRDNQLRLSGVTRHSQIEPGRSADAKGGGHIRTGQGRGCIDLPLTHAQRDTRGRSPSPPPADGWRCSGSDQYCRSASRMHHTAHFQAWGCQGRRLMSVQRSCEGISTSVLPVRRLRKRRARQFRPCRSDVSQARAILIPKAGSMAAILRQMSLCAPIFDICESTDQ